MSKRNSARLNDGDKTPTFSKCGNKTSKKANEMFEDVVESVTNIITRTIVTTEVKNKAIKRLYSCFLGKHMRIVKTIIKPQTK